MTAITLQDYAALSEEDRMAMAAGQLAAVARVQAPVEGDAAAAGLHLHAERRHANIADVEAAFRAEIEAMKKSLQNQTRLLGEVKKPARRKAAPRAGAEAARRA